MIFSILMVLIGGEVIAEGRVASGTVLTEDHLSGDQQTIERLVGRELKRTAFPGRPVTYADTKEPDLVDRNSIVRVLARKGQMTVETKARALGAGGAGEEILILNLESRRTVAATITGPGRVEVQL